ncbi:MAG: hypothetical protein ACLP0B_17935 [Steroidobacteraceae bacterium]|jgi:hypothetical protein
MIISNPVTGPVLGQPIHPNFGQQFAGTPPANTLVAPVPLAGGIQKSILEAAARGELPRNAMVTAVGGVSTGAQNPTPVDDLMCNGAGAQLNLGVAVAPNGGNPSSITTVGINNQVFVSGVANANDGLSIGPTSINIETLTSCPTACSTTVGNVTLNGSYQG